MEALKRENQELKERLRWASRDYKNIQKLRSKALERLTDAQKEIKEVKSLIARQEQEVSVLKGEKPEEKAVASTSGIGILGSIGLLSGPISRTLEEVRRIHISTSVK